MKTVIKNNRKRTKNNKILNIYEGYHLTPYNNQKKVKNFSPGPTNIPHSVFNEIGNDIFLEGKWSQGVTPLEISHRSPEFLKIKESCEGLIRSLLSIPKDYSLLWTHGGGNGQFSAVPLNLFKTGKSAGYYINGTWSNKSSIEAEKFGMVENINSNIDEGNDWSILEKDYSYLYFCSNETVDGLEFREDGFPLPEKNSFNTPVVVDMSSDLFTKKINWNKIDVVFACAPKNFGIPGSTIVIIKNELLENINFSENNNIIPSLLDWNVCKNSNSFFNTLPVFNIYITEKILKYYKKIGGLKKLEKNSKLKSDLFYDYIENSNFYKLVVNNQNKRSRMNIPFQLEIEGENSAEITIEFLKEAYINNIVGLRTKTPFQNCGEIEPLRASFYNGVGLSDVKYLIKFMEKFKKTKIS